MTRVNTADGAFVVTADWGRRLSLASSISHAHEASAKETELSIQYYHVTLSRRYKHIPSTIY
jgi:hypothetical protein